jgi:CarboxypepD_reg-like domain
MRQIVLISFLVFLSSCNKSYYGYVYDYDSKTPLNDVVVCDYLNNILTKTNSEGYFQLKKSYKISSVLVFSKVGYVSDSVKSIKIHAGESMEEMFKGEKIYLFSSKSNFRDSINKLNNHEK